MIAIVAPFGLFLLVNVVLFGRPMTPAAAMLEPGYNRMFKEVTYYVGSEANIKIIDVVPDPLDPKSSAFQTGTAKILLSLDTLKTTSPMDLRKGDVIHIYNHYDITVLDVIYDRKQPFIKVNVVSKLPPQSEILMTATPTAEPTQHPDELFPTAIYQPFEQATPTPLP